MITVISGTNRKGSATKVFAIKYYDFLRENLGEEVRFLALEDIEHDWYHAAMYQAEEMPESLQKVQEEFILPARGFVFVSPEYNGSFAGVLKLFIDACSIRKYKENFHGKTAALVGVASGRAGNLRGLVHLSGVLNYLGVTTLPDQLPISSIGGLLAEGNTAITSTETLDVMRKHADSYLQLYRKHQSTVDA